MTSSSSWAASSIGSPGRVSALSRRASRRRRVSSRSRPDRGQRWSPPRAKAGGAGLFVSGGRAVPSARGRGVELDPTVRPPVPPGAPRRGWPRSTFGGNGLRTSGETDRYRRSAGRPRGGPMSAPDEGGPRYDIRTDVKYGPLELIDIPAEIAGHEPWFNQTLAAVNDSVARL